MGSALNNRTNPGTGADAVTSGGADYYDRHHTERAARRAVQALEQQGYRFTLERVA